MRRHLICETEHSFNGYSLSTCYVLGSEDIAVKRADGHLPQSFFSSVQQGSRSHSGEKGNTVPQARTIVRATTGKGQTVSCSWIELREVWYKGRGK